MPDRAETVGELRRRVQRGAIWTVLLQQAAANRAGINITDSLCIGLLVSKGPQTPGRLAEAMSMTTGGAITALIDRLERGGYVRRVRDPEDRRRVLVEPVLENVARVAAYFDPIRLAFEDLAGEATDEQLRFLLEWYGTLDAMMPDVIDEIRALP